MKAIKKAKAKVSQVGRKAKYYAIIASVVLNVMIAGSVFGAVYAKGSGLLDQQASSPHVTDDQRQAAATSFQLAASTINNAMKAAKATKAPVERVASAAPVPQHKPTPPVTK